MFSRNRHDLREDRTRAFKPKIGHRDHSTILRKIHFIVLSGARHTGRTCTAQQKREVMATDDGSQLPTKQPTTAVHRTHVVFLVAACAVGRGCNVACVPCIVCCL